MLTPDYIKRVGRMMEQTSGCEHRDDPAPLPQIAGEQKTVRVDLTNVLLPSGTMTIAHRDQAGIKDY